VAWTQVKSTSHRELACEQLWAGAGPPSRQSSSYGIIGTSPSGVAAQAAQIRDRKARIDKLRHAVRAAMEAASPAAKEVAKSAIWSDAVSDDEVLLMLPSGSAAARV